jgi:hypothetical protein
MGPPIVHGCRLSAHSFRVRDEKDVLAAVQSFDEHLKPALSARAMWDRKHSKVTYEALAESSEFSLGACAGQSLACLICREPESGANGERAAKDERRRE